MDHAVYEDMYRLERSHWWFRARREILGGIVRRTVAPGSTILDVGCGTGFVLESLRSEYEVHGLDPAQVAVDVCHSRGLGFVEKGTLGSTDRTRDATRYDLVMFLDVIEHIEDDRAVLKAAAEVLAPAGHLLVAVPALQWLWSQHDVIHHHHRRYSRGALVRVLAASGFEPIYVSYFNTLLLPMILAARLLGRLWGGSGSNADFVPPRLVNELLYGTFRAEAALLRRCTLPVGVSLVCLARRRA